MQKIILTSVIVLLVTLLNAQNDKKGIDEQEIKKLSNDWMIATMNRDEKTLNKIVAAEFKLGGTDLDKPDSATGNMDEKYIWRILKLIP